MGLPDYLGAAVSAGICFAGFALEVIRIYMEIARLQARAYAKIRGQQAIYDAAYAAAFYVPSTDVPIHPAAIFFTPFFRILTCILLLLVGCDSIPGTTFFTDRIGDYVSLSLICSCSSH